MRLFTSFAERPAPIPPISVEALENRRLMSGSIVAADTTTSPVAALTVTAAAGSRFKGEVGTWVNADGLPKRGSGVGVVAIVTWGDGKTSHAKLVDDGSGTIQIVGSHLWAKPGTFQTLVNVEEFPTRHPRQLSEIGESTGEADISPRPHIVSIKGTFSGTYTSPINNPDVRSYDFTGTGTAHAMGAVALSGSISPPGFIKTGAAHGELTLTTTDSSAPSGTVTFDVTGHTQNGGGTLPEKLSYQIVDSTGAFANAKGRGTISVALDTTTNTFVLVIH